MIFTLKVNYGAFKKNAFFKVIRQGALWFAGFLSEGVRI